MLLVAFTQLLSCLLLVSCCDGSSLLYVRPDNYTLCPDHGEYCLTLSEYAQDLPHYLGPNTTLAFLPGHHILDTAFTINGSVSSALTFMASEPDRETQIACNKNSTFGFEHMDFVMFADLDIRCGSEYVKGGITTDSVICLFIQSCAFRDSIGTALYLINTSIVSTESKFHNLHPPSYYGWIELFVVNASFNNCTFANNSGRGMYLFTGSMTTSGTVSFENNRGNGYYHMHTYYTNVFLSGSIVFANNTGGTAMVLTESHLSLEGEAVFVENSGEYGSVYVSVSTANFIGSTRFINNTGDGSGALAVFESIVSFSGSTEIINNTESTIGGAIAVDSGSVQFSGRTVIINNIGFYGGAIGIINGTLNFSGCTKVINNIAMYGGAIAAANATFNFTGNTTFTNNTAAVSNGGAVYAASCWLNFWENSTTEFVNNAAMSGDGGAIFLDSSSKLIFSGSQLGTAWFQGNAANRGGALYVQDCNPLTYCLERILVLQDCFYDVQSKCTLPQPSCPEAMYFENNKATAAGYALYGGAIDTCTSTISFDDIASISDSPLEISSDPYIVCACNDTSIDCNQTQISFQVFPGGSLNVSAIAFGQRNGPAPATILAQPLYGQIQIGELETALVVNNMCTNLPYTIFRAPGNGTLLLYAQGACQLLGTVLTVQIEVVECPVGFKLTDSNDTCVCNDRLQRYTDACNIANQTITRDGTFWVGYDRDLDGVILYPNCPFDYCVAMPVSFVLEDYNAQCRYDRAGLLCGGCREGFSLLLGSSRCGKCSNSHLGLLVFFGVAGVLLVVFLLTFNLTVAVGTINGLIFYVNIVASNQAIFFPTESTAYLDFLKVFIAWVNLDFGIESCFYNGMDAHNRAWLEYAFPTYIWSLIVLVFVVSHFSQRASRILGSNPIAVLATLILLSYTNILRTIINGLHFATLEYPHGHHEQVWFYDGNVSFLKGKHLMLFFFSFLVMAFLFIPYTLLLLTSQWLQIKSHWKILSWLNKPQLRAFLDAYHASYKPKHRYWTGLLLLVRFAILLVSALNIDSDPAVNLLVVFIFALLILVWQLANGGVYRNWYLDILDSFFLLNLVFLVHTTYYVKYELSSSQFVINSGDRSHKASTTTLVTISFVVFVGIVLYHAYLRVRRTATWKTAVQKVTRRNDLQKPYIPAAEEDTPACQAPTSSFVSMSDL